MSHSEETIAAVMAERNVNRKSAVQYLRRQASKGLVGATIMPNGTVEAQHKLLPDTSAPVDKTETITSDDKLQVVLAAGSTPLQAIVGATLAAGGQNVMLVHDSVEALLPSADAAQTLAQLKDKYPVTVDIETRDPETGAPTITVAVDPNGKVWNPERAVALYKAGMKVSDIAVEMGYPKGQGQNRTVAALEKAGVYSRKKKA